PLAYEVLVRRTHRRPLSDCVRAAHPLPVPSRTPAHLPLPSCGRLHGSDRGRDRGTRPIHAEGDAGHPRRVRPARFQPGHEPGTRRRGRHCRPPPPARRAAVGRGRELPARCRPDQGPAASARRCAGTAVERMEPMNPEDLDTLAEYSTPRLRGDEAVISIRRPDLESNSYLSQLFALGPDRSRRLTHAWHDTDPQIHPNWSGFLRAERKAAAQLYVGSTLETAHQITDNH